MTHDRYVREIRTIGPDRCEVICEGDEPFVLYQRELLQYGIREDEVISAQTYETICDTILRPRARSRCLYLIEKQDYTVSQIRQKLSGGFYPQEIIEETITYLEQIRALDDRRYACAYIRSVSDRYSAQMIVQKLMQRGISRELAQELLSEEAEDAEDLPDEEAQIRSILQKRQYDPQTASPQERGKIRQMLLRKGYAGELIRSLT